MADATGTPTTNYGFKTLAGTDTAGYTSINAIVGSIDDELDSHFNGMIVLLAGAPPVSIPTGWTTYSVANGYPNAPSPPANHTYIIKT